MTTSTAAKKISGRFTVKNLPSFDVAEASKPLFAVVGVADFALEQVKDVPSLYAAEAKKVQTRISEVPAAVKTFPAHVKTLSTDVTDKATVLYSKLAVRGERLVTQIRRQPATEAAIAEGKQAVRKAEAAATAAKKSVKAGEKAAEGAVAKLG
ncbi:MAG: hypothetical protein H7323_04785 [Frankiales bacterium]|nr:hypothetical protein [Frankiales bacterium]